ncbi:MAG: ABC transporter permease subunit [Oscillospiraceae bacterium]|nr:ABC transporter permease subunit [Oscillospiraceae bacterium]MCL2279819.1 ABC transporter permease subunit [Oscillospiraceae bacterium]
MKASLSTRGQISRSLTKPKWIRFIPVYLLMLPGLAYFFINNYMPLPGITVAFRSFNARLGIFGSPWVGFDNFQFLFATQDAWIITRNTLLYNAAFIVINTTLAIFLAVILNELRGKMKNFFQSSILLPNMISAVIIGYIVFGFLSVDSGFFNTALFPFLGIDPISWYSEPGRWPFILVIVNAWRGVGVGTIIYLATLVGIDRSYYESAMIDGANRWKQFIYITLPLLKPTIIMLTLLAIGRIFFADFGLFFQVPMNSGALFSTTNVIDTYVFRGLIQLGNISMSAAAGLYQSVVGFILVLTANLVIRKIDRESALI